MLDAPSLEPTVLKYPAENPPLKAPWNLRRPSESVTYTQKGLISFSFQWNPFQTLLNPRPDFYTNNCALLARKEDTMKVDFPCDNSESSSS